MGLVNPGLFARRRSSSELLAERRVIRFQRVLERHCEILDVLSDLKEKESGEYILDRQFMEARMDRAYECARQMLFDGNVICDSQAGTGYSHIDRLRLLSEKVLHEASGSGTKGAGAEAGDGPDWEQRALGMLFLHLTQGTLPDGSESDRAPPSGSSLPQSLAGWAMRTHENAARWIAERLAACLPSPAASLSLFSEQAHMLVFPLADPGRAGNGFLDALDDVLSNQHRGRYGAASDSPLHWLLHEWQTADGGLGSPLPRWNRSNRRPERRNGDSLVLVQGDGRLLLCLPASVLPLRVLFCSASPAETGNLFYVFGDGPFPLRRGLPAEHFFVDGPPHPSFVCTSATAWMHCEPQLSCPQFQERIRLAGQMLSSSISRVQGGSRTDKEIRRCEGTLWDLMAQIAPSDFIRKETRDGTAASHHGGG